MPKKLKSDVFFSLLRIWGQPHIRFDGLVTLLENASYSLLDLVVPTRIAGDIKATTAKLE